MDKKHKGFQELSEKQLDLVSGGGDFDFDCETPLVIPGINNIQPKPNPDPDLFDPFGSEYIGIPSDEGESPW